MNAAPKIRLFVIILAAITLAVVGAETTFTLPAETAKLKPGPGLELVNSQCLLCHSVDYISTQPRLPAPQWRAVVVKMQAKYGAPIATNKIDVLVDYLVKNYGTGAVGTTLPPAK